MIDLTREAQIKFDEYMGRTRRALRGRRERTDVEQSVREHIETALSGASAPVGTSELSAVLAQLGPPEQWIAPEDQPAWKRVVTRLLVGPEDWRLAYLSFAFTLLTFFLLPAGGIFFLIPAYLLSRAHVELVAERGESLGARRWLVLPPIVVIAAILTVAALVAPIAGFGAWLIDQHGLAALWPGHSFTSQFEYTRVVAGTVAIGAGVWWIVLAGIVAIVLQPFRALVAPVANGLTRKHTLVLVIAGLIAIGAGALALFVVR